MDANKCNQVIGMISMGVQRGKLTNQTGRGSNMPNGGNSGIVPIKDPIRKIGKRVSTTRPQLRLHCFGSASVSSEPHSAGLCNDATSGAKTNTKVDNLQGESRG